VGGGEIWDEPIRAIVLDWKENDENSHRYHIVSGGAGGWLASGITEICQYTLDT